MGKVVFECKITKAGENTPAKAIIVMALAR
jgi:hypothetical protein